MIKKGYMFQRITWPGEATALIDRKNAYVVINDYYEVRQDFFGLQMTVKKHGSR